MLEFFREKGMEGLGRFYSVYRGQVVNNEDPKKINRVEINIPQILPSGTTVWALAKGQDGSLGSGFKGITPKVGDIVYVEFERGDPGYPLWSYHGYAIDEVPDQLNSNNKVGVVTPKGNYIVIDDDDDTLTLEINTKDKEKVHKITFLNDSMNIETPMDINITTEKKINIKAESDINITSSQVTNAKSTKNYNIDGENIILNGGRIGTPMSDKVVERLNKIETDISQLKQALSIAGASAVPQDGGRTAFLTLQSYISSPLMLTTLPDIEHKTVKQ